MLVLGSRGAGGFTALILGSVSRYAATNAACPVVVVREETTSAHREIVVGVHDPAQATAALGFAFEEAALRQAALVATHARARSPFDRHDEPADAEQRTLDALLGQLAGEVPRRAGQRRDHARPSGPGAGGRVSPGRPGRARQARAPAQGMVPASARSPTRCSATRRARWSPSPARPTGPGSGIAGDQAVPDRARRGPGTSPTAHSLLRPGTRASAFMANASVPVKARPGSVLTQVWPVQWARARANAPPLSSVTSSSSSGQALAGPDELPPCTARPVQQIAAPRLLGPPGVEPHVAAGHHGDHGRPGAARMRHRHGLPAAGGPPVCEQGVRPRNPGAGLADQPGVAWRRARDPVHQGRTVYLVHVAPFHWYMSVVHEVPVQPSWLPIQTSVLLSTAASFGMTPLGRATGCQLVPS